MKNDKIYWISEEKGITDFWFIYDSKYEFQNYYLKLKYKKTDAIKQFREDHNLKRKHIRIIDITK